MWWLDVAWTLPGRVAVGGRSFCPWLLLTESNPLKRQQTFSFSKKVPRRGGMETDWSALTIATSSVPEPSPDASDCDSYHPSVDGRWCLSDFQGQRWRYHIEWGHDDLDLLPGNENDDTRRAVVWAYCRLPNEDRATRRAREAARRAAREAGHHLPEDDDPAVQTIIFAHIRLVAGIVGRWTRKFLDAKARGMEARGQVALATLRAGKRIRWAGIKRIDKKLDALAQKAESLEKRRAKAFDKIKTEIQEKIKADGVEKLVVSAPDKPSYNKVGERQWYMWQNATAKLCSIRRKRDALERKRWLAMANMHVPKQPRGKCGATIAEELFAECLLKLVKLVPLLPRLGKRYEWDAYDAPDHIARYVRKVATNAIWDYVKANRPDRKSAQRHFAHLRRWKEENNNWTAYYEAVGDGESPHEDDADDNTESVYDGNTCYVAQSSGSGIVELEEQEYVSHTIDLVCDDIKDRLLLTMKREGVLTEDEIGELLDLGVKRVSMRWWRMREKFVELFELSRREGWNQEEHSKRVTRDPKKRTLAEELVASWRSPIRPISYVPAPHFPLSPIANALLNATRTATSAHA
jgi:hypothetical protein